MIYNSHFGYITWYRILFLRSIVCTIRLTFLRKTMHKRISPPPIVNDITETIGNTPIVNFKSLINKQKNDLSSSKIEFFAKSEYLNSLSGSIKDRIARNILIG